MAKQNTMSLIYYGGDADLNRLDFYDASNSYYGLARTLAIIGHYYIKQEIIVKAPQSAMPLYLSVSEDGSYRQNIIVGVASAMIAVPFVVFAQRLLETWVPDPSPELHQIIELLKEQNELLRKREGLPAKDTLQDKAETEAADKFIKQNDRELAVVRSVTSDSFKRIFRPIGRSVDNIGIIGGAGGTPRFAVNAEAVARIEADEVDDQTLIIMAVVNSFSRSSKTGVAYSRDLMTSVRIEYAHKEKLPSHDDFSWSQYQQKPLKMSGRFVRFFDGTIKKILVFHVERVTRQDEIDDYYSQKN